MADLRGLAGGAVRFAEQARRHGVAADGALMSSPIIRTRGLTKRFGSFTAVDGVGLEIAPARSSPSSARTARGRARPSAC